MAKLSSGFYLTEAGSGRVALSKFCDARGKKIMMSAKTSILVIDDDVRILRMIQRVLELENYRVLMAVEGKTALEIFDEETPTWFCLIS